MLAKHFLIVLMVGGLSAIVAGYMVYFYKVMSLVKLTIPLLNKQRPEVRFVPDSRFAKFILEKCDILNETFYPTWWAGSSLLQTIVPTIFRGKLAELKYTKRDILNCPDGGTVSLDWFEDSSSSSKNGETTKPIALMLPGLIGDSQSDYLRNVIPSIHKLGYRVVAFNNRGRGGMKLTSPRIYCAANFDDIELAIDHIRGDNPDSKIIASGFSMGGMVLTRYLAERGDKVKVDAAMLVSANYDLVNGTKNMETGYLHRFVAKIMTKALVDVLMSEKDVLSKTDKPVQWEKLRDATSFRELDRYFTCPMWGYKDPEDYFIDSTNNNRLPKISVPTLAINSGDDIFSPYETLPLDKLNKFIVFTVTHRGGHLGFMDSTFPKVPYYGDRLIEQFYKTMLDVPEPRKQFL